MAIHSSILGWEIPWIEEPGGLQSVGLQRVGHDLATKPPTTTVDLQCVCVSLFGLFCFCLWLCWVFTAGSRLL